MASIGFSDASRGRELRPVLQTGQGCGDGPAEALHIETGATPYGSLLDEFSQFDLLGMARDARNLRPTVERGLSQPFFGEDQPMPSPDLADAGQLPGDFVQQGQMGFSEVEHGREQSANRKDSAVGITKQPDHETPIHQARQRQCAAAAAAFDATAHFRPSPRGRGQSRQRTPPHSKVHAHTVSAPVTKTVLPLRACLNGVVSISGS